MITEGGGGDSSILYFAQEVQFVLKQILKK